MWIRQCKDGLELLDGSTLIASVKNKTDGVFLIGKLLSGAVPGNMVRDDSKFVREMGHGPATGNVNTKPTTKWIESPYHSSRNGVSIKGVVMHYTAPGSMAGVIDWFTRSSKGVCSHYLIGKDGAVIQFVKDGDRCSHASGHNVDTIGIEHYSHGESLTPAQSAASAQLCRYLVEQYPTIEYIQGHRFLYGQKVSTQGTDCPAGLFGSFNFDSLQQWVRQNVGEKWVPKITSGV